MEIPLEKAAAAGHYVYMYGIQCTERPPQLAICGIAYTHHPTTYTGINTGLSMAGSSGGGNQTCSQ